MSESRRIRMTKKIIQSAMLELLETMPFSKISVKKICETADVNRSTFYSHYINTSTLLEEIEDDVISHIPDSIDFSDKSSQNKALSSCTCFFDYVKENAKLFKILLIKSDNINFKNKLIDSVIKKHFIEYYTNDNLIPRYNFIFSINGIISLMIKWIEDDFPISPNKFAQLTYNLAIGIMKNNS